MPRNYQVIAWYSTEDDLRNETHVWLKWGIFMSEGEDWEVYGKLRNMGRIRSQTFHICPTKSAKSFNTMQKLFHQL